MRTIFSIPLNSCEFFVLKLCNVEEMHSPYFTLASLSFHRLQLLFSFRRKRRNNLTVSPFKVEYQSKTCHHNNELLTASPRYIQKIVAVIEYEFRYSSVSLVFMYLVVKI